VNLIVTDTLALRGCAVHLDGAHEGDLS
jgi:hypothetical protein